MTDRFVTFQEFEKVIRNLRKLIGSGGGSGAVTFLDLTDTPSSYTGQSGKVVAVKTDESGLEFIAAGSGSCLWSELDTTNIGVGDNVWVGLTPSSPSAGNFTLFAKDGLAIVPGTGGGSSNYYLSIYRQGEFFRKYSSFNSQTANFVKHLGWGVGGAYDSGAMVHPDKQGSTETFVLSVTESGESSSSQAGQKICSTDYGTYVWAIFRSGSSAWRCKNIYRESMVVGSVEFGTTGTGDGEWQNPQGLVAVGDYLYVCDRTNDRIQKFTLTGTFSAKSTTTYITDPWDIDYWNGYLFVIDGSGYVVVLNASDLSYVTRLYSPGTGNYQIDTGKCISFAYKSDFTPGVVIGMSGKLVWYALDSSSMAELDTTTGSPEFVVSNAKYICASYETAKTIKIFDKLGSSTWTITSTTDAPYGLAVDNEYLYALWSDGADDVVMKKYFLPTRTLVATFDGFTTNGYNSGYGLSIAFNKDTGDVWRVDHHGYQTHFFSNIGAQRGVKFYQPLLSLTGNNYAFVHITSPSDLALPYKITLPSELPTVDRAFWKCSTTGVTSFEEVSFFDIKEFPYRDWNSAMDQLCLMVEIDSGPYFYFGKPSYNFTELGDTPSSYTGQGGLFVKVKADESGLEFASGGGGATTFVALTDTPDSYTGQANNLVRVKADETGLEFYTFSLPSHASSHQSGGSDAIKLDDLATPDDNTDLNATTARHGLLPKLSGSTTQFLRGDGSWATPPSGGGSGSDEISVYQASHGFSVCDVVRLSGSGWVKAQANSSTNAEMFGVVSGVVDTDNFKVKSCGLIQSANVPNYSAGTVVFLSDTTAGAMTNTPPSDVGDVEKPVGIIIEPQVSMVVIPYRGVEITSDYVPHDLFSFRKIGTTGFESWFTIPLSNTAMTTGALTANRLYAFPFVVGRTATLDRIAINVTTAASGSKARCGIYDTNDNGYPYNLVVDSGELDSGTTGIKSTTISQSLPGGHLYWLVVVSSGTPTLRCAAAASVLTPLILGTSSSLGTTHYLGLYVSYTYAALPSTFPSSPTMITGTPIPLVFYRIASYTPGGF